MTTVIFREILIRWVLEFFHSSFVNFLNKMGLLRFPHQTLNKIITPFFNYFGWDEIYEPVEWSST